MPANPSWLVATGVCIVAAMPQNIPSSVRRVLIHPVGAFALIMLTVWLLMGPSPILAVSLLLLFGSVSLLRIDSRLEPFMTPVLNKDIVGTKEKRRWLSEEILQEEPDAIQERTEEPPLRYNQVTDNEEHPWESETTLNEHTVAIQERPVSTPPEYDESSNSLRH